jgi:hypothetical protein
MPEKHPKCGSQVKAFVQQQDRTIKFGRQEYQDFISKLFDLLTDKAGYLQRQEARSRKNEPTFVYRLKIDKILWRAGDGETVPHDAVKFRSYKSQNQQPNRFFRDLYLTDFAKLKPIRGQDHTGQLRSEDREQREKNFRSGELSVLFCSPTMELGVDISELNVVHMRNAPPNAANYTQRSGRAGRSGQAALVFTYCSSYSPHDRHFFRFKEQMVAGSVEAPRIDLRNRDLIRSHLHALFLTEIGMPDLHDSILDLIDENDAVLPMKIIIKSRLSLDKAQVNKVTKAFERALRDILPTLANESWFDEEWPSKELAHLERQVDQAMARWRNLYRQARSSLSKATATIDSGRFSKGSKEYDEAERLQRQSTRQLALLKNTREPGRSTELSEFYVFRYLAAEGFLPGYNFTRLPVRVFVEKGDTGEYISRPRFIALREFGPRNIIYHNGSKYEINQVLLPDLESNIVAARASRSSGYWLQGNQATMSCCPLTGVDLTENSERADFPNLLELPESKTRPREYINCEEEERRREGFAIETYFCVPDGDMGKVGRGSVFSGGEKLLNLSFIPAAQLIQVNRKPRKANEDGFLLGMTSGFWRTAEQLEKGNLTEQVRSIMLYTTNTADALYIEPIKSLALNPAGVRSLQYAIKHAIQNVFQIEPAELAVVSMGHQEHPNIFLYEASEGSLGVLSQFVSDVHVFHQVINEAIRLCRYDDADYLEKASYDDLLSYYNQPYHLELDRFLIRDALEKLRLSELQTVALRFSSYEEQYRVLFGALDPSSSTERRFLTRLYERGLRMPDAAQKSVPGIYCRPDFFYEPDVWIFCDGSPHDQPVVQERDESQRAAIKTRGHEVIVFHYRDNLDEMLDRYPDVFRPVKT